LFIVFLTTGEPAAKEDGRIAGVQEMIAESISGALAPQ
jgi:hypothetical protein